MSAQVTDIFPNAQLEGNKAYKRRISEVSTGRGRRRGRGRGRFSRGSSRGGREGRCGSERGRQDNPPVVSKTFNSIDICDPTREISAQDWEKLGWDGQAYVSRLCNRGIGRGQGGRQVKGDVRGTNSAVREANITSQGPAKEQTAGKGFGTGRGSRNGAQFGGGGY